MTKTVDTEFIVLKDLRDKLSICLPLSCRIQRLNGTRTLRVSDGVSPVAIISVEGDKIIFTLADCLGVRTICGSWRRKVCVAHLADPAYVKRVIDKTQELAHEKIKKATQWGTKREKLAAVKLRARMQQAIL